MISTETRSAMYGILALFFLASAYGNSSPSMASSVHEPFIGQDRWEPEYLDMCEMEEAEQSSLYCGVHDFDYQRINFEVVSEEPILIIFRNLLSPEHVEELLLDITSVELYQQKVVNGTSEAFSEIVSTSRVANGTFVSNEYTAEFKKAIRMSQAALPFVNFSSSEGWQILSYLPGGHYSHHYDYLSRRDDGWFPTHGNRFATFLLVLQNAEKGGGTVFPSLATTVKASPGDAVFWLNMDAQQELEPLSLHGGCVVREGEKIVAVQWIRALYQDILHSASSDGRFDIGKLIAPDRYLHGKCRAEEDHVDPLDFVFY